MAEIKKYSRKPHEQLDFSHRTALVTGASRGIGLEINNCLVKLGCNVFTPSRSELNLSDIDSINEYVEKHRQDPIDIIINDAAINPAIPLDEMEPELIEEIIRVNQTAPILLTRGLTDYMKENSWGRVVNISSIWGVMGRGARTVYSTTKFALDGMTRSLSQEYGKHGILVNSVCPGFVDTEMTRRNLSAEQLEALMARVPLGRLAQPEEIANAVAFLASDMNTFITGQSIVVDGGFTA